jgi:hypothetical protein
MAIKLRIRLEPGIGAWLVAADEVENREVRSVDDMRQLLADRGESLTERQCHGLGLVTAILTFFEFVSRYRPDQIGKALDAVYFPLSSRGSGQAFSRAVGEGTFLLRRAQDLTKRSPRWSMTHGATLASVRQRPSSLAWIFRDLELSG